MYSDNYIFEKENLKDMENNFSEKKILSTNDNNNGQYDRQVKFQLSQLFNLNSLMNFSESLLVIPLQLTIDKFTLTDINDIKKLFSLKSGSLITGLNLRINGETIVNYSNNLNEIIEFEFLSKTYSSNQKEYERSFHFIGDPEFTSYSSENLLNNSVFYQNGLNEVNGVKVYKNGLSNYCLLENNRLLMGSSEPLNGNVPNSNFLSNERQSTYSQASNKITIDYYYCIKLKEIHPIFHKLGISRAFVDFDIDVNLGSTNLTLTQIPADTKSLLAPTIPAKLSLSNNFNNNNICPLYFNIDGIYSSVGPYWNSNTVYTAVYDQIMTFKLDINKSIGCKLYTPIYKLKPSINEIYIKDTNREVVFNDYLYFNQPNIAANSTINFTLTNSIVNAKYLLIVPNLTKNKQSLFNVSSLLNGPLSLQNLMVYKSGSLFNSQINYTYDAFINYISENNNVNGGNDWVSTVLDFEKFNKIYRLYFIDLELTNNERNVAYNLSVEFMNNNKLPINVDFYVYCEKRLTLNKLNGAILSKE